MLFFTTVSLTKYQKLISVRVKIFSALGFFLKISFFIKPDLSVAGWGGGGHSPTFKKSCFFVKLLTSLEETVFRQKENFKKSDEKLPKALEIRS